MERTIDLPDAEATEQLAHAIASIVTQGDTLLLDGPLGAGKSHFARALIQRLMSLDGSVEDVPSPTFTLVQTYTTSTAEIWHADLYRLSDPGEVAELGLLDAMGVHLVLIEWASRLGDERPDDALFLRFDHAGPARTVRLTSTNHRWAELFTDVDHV